MGEEEQMVLKIKLNALRKEIETVRLKMKNSSLWKLILNCLLKSFQELLKKMVISSLLPQMFKIVFHAFSFFVMDILMYVLSVHRAGEANEYKHNLTTDPYQFGVVYWSNNKTFFLLFLINTIYISYIIKCGCPVGWPKSLLNCRAIVYCRVSFSSATFWPFDFTSVSNLQTWQYSYIFL